MANPRRIDQFVGSIQTSNATQTVVATFTLPNNCAADFDVCVVGRILGTGAQSAAGYWRRARYRVDTSTAAIIGTIKTPVADDENDAAWDVTLTVATNVVSVQVTGVAATTINWECWGTVHILTN